MIGSILVLAITVLPSDRMAMADRLFNRGQHKEAEAEYRALVGAEGIAADEILFRLAECDRASGRSEAALKGYVELFTKYPDSSHAARARFLNAMGRPVLERRKLLAELDSRIITYYGDGFKGMPRFAPYNKVIVTCGAPNVPLSLMDQLVVGGTMVIPVGDESHTMKRLTKIDDNHFDEEVFGNFVFVPMLKDIVSK